MQKIANIVAENVKEMRFNDLSSGSVEKAKRSILDTLGCMIAGRESESTKALRRALSENGPNLSSLVVLNSASAHSIEMDDFHNQGTVHPGAVVVPATLATARGLEKGDQISGRKFIEAICAGYEVMIKVGKSGKGSFYSRGFHPTSVCGAFGSTAAVGKMLDVKAEILTKALGIAGCYASGLLEYKSEGSWTKRLQVGLSSRAGMEAVNLAVKGFTGPKTIFEGEWGFLRAYLEESNPQELTENSDFKNIAQISYKPYACCRYIHAAIDVIISIVMQHDIKPEDINEINVYTHQQAITSTMKPEKRKYNPENEVDAQFSLPYCLAIAATYGNVYPKKFSAQYRRNPGILSLAKKVKASIGEEMEKHHPNQNGAKVEMMTKKGVFKRGVENSRGDPGNPLSKNDLVTKFHVLTKPMMGKKRRAEVSNRIMNLEREKSVNFLSELLLNSN